MKINKKYCALIDSDNGYDNQLLADKLEQIADEYAIEILEFYHNGLFMIPLKNGEAKKILNHIKKEKGL